MTTALFIITSNNRTPQLLNRSYSCLHLLQRRNNGGLFTAHSGRVCDKTAVSVNKTCEWPVWAKLRPFAKNLWMAWSEKVLIIDWDLKKHWVDFYHYRVVVYTPPKHIYIQTTCKKVNFASNDPFKESLKNLKFKAIRSLKCQRVNLQSTPICYPIATDQ